MSLRGPYADSNRSRRMIYVNFQINYLIRYEANGNPPFFRNHTRRLCGNFEMGRYGNRNRAVDRRVEQLIREFVRDYDRGVTTHDSIDHAVSMTVERYSIVNGEAGIHVNEVPQQVCNNTYLPMRDYNALSLDNEGDLDWDTRQNTCVFDYLKHLYSDTKGLKKIVNNYDKMNDIFLESTFDGYMEQEGKIEGVNPINPLTDGVCANMIKHFCQKMGIAMYVLDCHNNRVDFWVPNRNAKDTRDGRIRNSHAKSLCFRIHNNHLYPIESLTTNHLVQHFLPSGNFQKKEPIKKRTGVKVESQTVTCSEDEPFFKKALDIMVQEKTQIFPFNNIVFDGDLRSFLLKKKRYIFETDEDKLVNDCVKTFCANHDEAYEGQTVGSILCKIMDETHPDYIRSCPNKAVNNVLRLTNIKNRVHIGLTDPTDEILQSDVSYDITRCYTSCIVDPMEDWISVKFEHVWEPYDGNLTLGLYQVVTNDMTILHGSNVYSNSILNYARSYGIEMNIIKQLKVKKEVEKDYFKQIIDKIAGKCNFNCKGGCVPRCAECQINKILCNRLVGMVGKTYSTKYKVGMNTDILQIFNQIQKYTNPFIWEETIGDTKYFLYGDKSLNNFNHHNLPCWIQILDQSNILLHKMATIEGGKVVHRKTDCVTLRKE